MNILMRFWLHLLICCGCFLGCAEDVDYGDEAYGDPINVELTQGSVFSPGGVILNPPILEDGFVNRCTFDGTEPNSETEVFIEPKKLRRNAVVRCVKYQYDTIPGDSKTQFYFVGQPKKMPVIAIAVNPDYYEDYIDASPCKPNPCVEAKFWEDVEVPAFIEYFPKGSFSDDAAFSENVGIKISGGWSRNQKKKSVTIVMRKSYGVDYIRYPLFETRPENSKFKSFMLRNNGNRFISDYFVDAVGAGLLEGTGLDYQRSKQVVVFFNGNYGGIYDMCEKENEYYVENNYGINHKAVNVIKHIHNKIEVVNGSAEEYKKLLKFAVSHDFKGKGNKFYTQIGKMMDLPNYANYMAAEIYFQNGDWPNNNVRAWNRLNQPWKFMVYDLDYGFDWGKPLPDFNQRTNMVQWIMKGGASGYPCYDHASKNCFHSLFVKLIENPDFKRMFLNHASVLYSRYINGEMASAAVDKMNALLDMNEVKRDLNAFSRKKYTNSCGKGFDANGSCIKKWMKERESAVWEDLKKGLNLEEIVPVEFKSAEKGNVYIEDILLPQSGLTAMFFEDNPILIRAEASPSYEFISWVDGSTENPRLISPSQGMKIGALFR